jgi:hypothetical protein
MHLSSLTRIYCFLFNWRWQLLFMIAWKIFKISIAKIRFCTILI